MDTFRHELNEQDRAELFEQLDQLVEQNGRGGFPTPPAGANGLQLLQWLLSVDQHVLGLLTDEQLEQIDHCYPQAIANHEILPAVVQRCSALRMDILGSLARRKVEREQLLSHSPYELTAALADSEQRTGDQGDGGAKVPTHPKPSTKPSGGAAVPVPMPLGRPATITF